MANSRVICLGEILFDCLADQPGRSLEEVESWTPYPGGAPANVACALVKLGTSAAFVGAVGQDDDGNSLVQLLQDVGVDVRGVQKHPAAPTRLIYVLRSETGDRQFAGFGQRHASEFADTHLLADKIPQELFEEADFLVMGTLELAYPETREAIARALELAEEHHVKILLDVNWRPVFWEDEAKAKVLIENLLQKVDFVKLSEEEAEWLFETTDPEDISRRLDAAEGILVTAGDKGCFYYLGDTKGRLPAFSVAAVDTTGAGDSFLAGFLHQLCQNGINSLTSPIKAQKTVVYASAVGALTTTKLGAIAAQPTPEEVEAFLATNSF
jgi:fructokinase